MACFFKEIAYYSEAVLKINTIDETAVKDDFIKAEI